MKIRWLSLTVFLISIWGSSAALAQNVSVTPLGSRSGEFCRNDRALIFQDPDGTRILYDPGRTVTGGTDGRLGTIDVMLLSHVHVDHLGEFAYSAVDTVGCGTNITLPSCATSNPATCVDKTPNSNFAEIAKATNAAVPVGGEMPGFLNAKISALGGPTNLATTLRPGGKFMKNGVTIATVAALHSNGVPGVFLGANAPAGGVTAYVGPEEGYVIKFSNGLVAYLSGDTGVITDMDTIVRQQYGAKLAVINIGDVFSTGPEEAAYAINNLIKPKSVIPSHANEAATIASVVQPGTKTQKFIDLVSPSIHVHVPLSGGTMEFNGAGVCVGGC